MGPRLLPIEEAAPVREERIPTIRRGTGTPTFRSNPRVREYGEGMYGVAMPTHDPRWVFKITHDPSEAAFVNAVRKLGLRCALRGIVRVSPVYRTEDSYHHMEDADSDTWVYWREAATEVDAHAYERLAERRATMVEQARIRIQRALDILRAEDRPNAFTDLMVACEELDRNPLLADTAEDLRMLARKGVVVTDIHLGNWGIIPRRPNKLTLIDPGVVKFISNGAMQAARGIPRL